MELLLLLVLGPINAQLLEDTAAFVLVKKIQDTYIYNGQLIMPRRTGSTSYISRTSHYVPSERDGLSRITESEALDLFAGFEQKSGCIDHQFL